MHECVPTDKNIHILFHEQAVNGRGTKCKKDLLNNGAR